MQYFPPALENLVEQFARLPGVGVKSAQRLAFHVLSLPEEDAAAFAQGSLSYDPEAQCADHGHGHGEHHCGDHGDHHCGGQGEHHCGDHGCH